MTGSAYDWSPTAASNTATPPNGAPAGMTGSQCEPLFRQMMAATADLARSLTAGGTSDAITATLPNAPSALVDGMEVRVRAASANATTAPSFNLNSLGAHTTTRLGGQPLSPGDVFGNLHEILLRYNLANTRWELVNPAWGRVARGYLSGLTLSNDGTTPNTKIDIAAGLCADDTNVIMMPMASGSVDFTTTGANALDTGTIASGTWYHVFAIAGSSGTAFLASTSASSPTLPSGYTYKRRLGSVKTDGSAHLLAFKQFGDIFQWSPVSDLTTVTTTSANRTLYTISTPPGVQTQALIRYDGFCSTTQFLVTVTSPDEPDTPATGANVDLAASQGIATAGSKPVLTNTSSQIGVRTSAASTFSLATYGWIDRRGRDA